MTDIIPTPVGECPTEWREFLLSKAKTRDSALLLHRFTIPAKILAEVVDAREIDTLWAWILTHIPPDSTPAADADGPGVVREIRAGEYCNEWAILFYSEAFGSHPEQHVGGILIPFVEIAWQLWPGVKNRTPQMNAG